MKVCSKCNVEKELDYFYKMKGGKYGVQGRCKTCHCKKVSAYNNENAKTKSEYMTSYYKENRSELLSKSIKYASENRICRSAYHAQYVKARRENDTTFRILLSLRARIYQAVKGTNKSANTIKLLGCDPNQARDHIEAQFTDGMTWGNYGMHGWHIDHIIPCARFDLTDPEQQRQCFHFTNLQPLWAKDNIRKGDKMPHQLSQTKGGVRPALTAIK